MAFTNEFKEIFIKHVDKLYFDEIRKEYNINMLFSWKKPEIEYPSLKQVQKGTKDEIINCSLRHGDSITFTYDINLC